MIQLIYNKKTITLANKILEKKSFVFCYSKFFVRNSFDNKSVVLDDSFEVSLFPVKVVSHTNGFSFVANKILYKHKLYKDLKFYWFNPNRELHQNLNACFKSIASKNYIVFLKIMRGGLQCYSCGLKGILPKDQFKTIIKWQKANLPGSELTYFINLRNNSKYFFFKSRTNWLKMVVYPTNFNRFNKTSLKRKAPGLNNTLNIVFNCSEYDYENKKVDKKTRKQYSKKKN